MAGPQQQSAEFIVSLIDKFTVNADTIARSVTSLNTHVEASGNQFKKFSRDFSENMENIKKGAELLGEVGITLIGVRESLEAGARMTGAITDIGQSARLSGERLKGLTENIDTLGERWATSNEGIANAAKNLSQDVVQNAKTFDTIMDASLQFATSTTNNYQDRITRLGEITASVQPIMHGFGVSAEGVSDVFDAIRATADASNIPVNTFMQNLGQMSSEAKELGYSGVKGVREFGTDVALLARSTGDAQGAFNKTFQIINRLMRPEDFVGLRQIGVNMRDVMTFASAHNMDPLLASIQAIRQRMIDMGLTAQGQTLVLEKLLGGRGLAGAFLSVSDQISHMGVIQDQIFKSHNLNARDAAEKTQLWTFAWQRLTGSIDHLFTDTLGEDIGKGLAPFVLQMDHLVEGVAHFTEANPAFTQGVVDIGLAFAGIKLVETAIGVAKLASSLKILFGLTPPKWFLPVVALMETYELNKEASGGNDIPSLWGRLQSDAAKDFGGGRAPAAGVSPTWAIPNVRGRRATGGPVSGGAAYVVGENGPEVFVPGMNGSIMPNGGGGSNIEAAIFRGVSEGTKTGIKDGLREFFLSGLGRMAGGYTNGAIGPIAALSGASGDWGGSVARSAGSSPRFSGPVRAARVKGGAAAHALMDRLINVHGWTPEAASIAAANADSESSFNPNAVGDSGISHGLFQWNKDRFAGLQEYANQRGKDWHDFDTQVDYFAQEAPKRVHGLNRVTSLDNAGQLSWDYEGYRDRGEDYARAAKAHGYLNKYGTALASGGHGTHPLEASLNFHARPTLDDSHIDRAIGKAKQLRQLLASGDTSIPGDSYWNQHWTQRHRLDSRLYGGTLQGE